jgi:hypothetical protein
MRKNILMAIVLLVGISFIACEETTSPIEENGTIEITSTPAGAEIWLDSTNTNKVTPATITASAGAHIVTLKKEGYADLSIPVSVTAGEPFLLNQNTTLAQFGSLNIESEPAGAEIWIGGTNTNEITPATISSLESGNYEITLKLGALGDTTLTPVAVVDGAQTDVTAQLQFGYAKFGFSEPIQLWETTGTSAAQPSGLDLSSGNAFGTSDSDNNSKIDIYYFSDSAGNTYIVRSSHFSSKMSRDTYFKVSSSSEINDGINSTAKDGNWERTLAITETNYAFLYDNDGNYSKLIIVDEGETDQKAWVKVKWIYNKVQDDLAF